MNTIHDYNELIDQYDLYVEFVVSEQWRCALTEIVEISKEVADNVSKYGIGMKLSDDGSYDFESGQLLDDMPEVVRDRIRSNNQAYEAICNLASTYALYVRTRDLVATYTKK